MKRISINTILIVAIIIMVGGIAASPIRFESASLASLGALTETNGGIPYGTADNTYAWLAAGAQGTLLMGNGAGAPSFLGAGTAGYFLLANGANDPVWTTQPTLTSLEGLTLTNGDIIYASDADTLVVLDHGTAGYLLQANGVAAPSWVVATSSLPKNYITGLTLSNDTDTEHDIAITAGECRDSTDAADIVLAAEITKQIDAGWSVGDDAGGLDTGAVAAATIYSVWLIKRSDTGVVDALFSLSMTAPTMPANYDYKRFIGFVWTLDAAATIKPFIMTDGEIWFTKASQCIVVTGAKTLYTTYGETPIDLSGDLPTGHYDSVLFGCQAAITTTILSLSSDGTNSIGNSHGAVGDIADGEINAWAGGSSAVGFPFIPLKVADTVYMIAYTQDANNVSLLIHAVKLKYR